MRDRKGLLLSSSLLTLIEGLSVEDEEIDRSNDAQFRRLEEVVATRFAQALKAQGVSVGRHQTSATVIEPSDGTSDSDSRRLNHRSRARTIKHRDP
jgi:hypothetical protein